MPAITTGIFFSLNPDLIWFFYLKLSLNRLPPENLTVLLALMVIASPVEGLRPCRSARVPSLSFPIPASWTLPFSLSSLTKRSAWASSISLALAFVMPVLSANALTSSFNDFSLPPVAAFLSAAFLAAPPVVFAESFFLGCHNLISLLFFKFIKLLNV